MYHIFPNVAHFIKCGAFFQVGRSLFKVRRIFPSWVHFPGLPIVFNVPHLSKYAANFQVSGFFQVWPTYF